jgi:type VI protein secretion system component Hcp
MFNRKNCTRLTSAATLSAAFAGALAMGVGVSAQTGDAVIRGCVGNNGGLRIIAAGDSCKNNESLLTWNAAGPSGLTGPAGPTGPVGPAGPQGPAGRDGRDGQATPPPTVMGQMRISGLAGVDPSTTTPIFSFSSGATNSVTAGSGGGGAGAGKVDFADFLVTKMLDGFSAPMLHAAEVGTHIQSVQIDVFQAGGVTPFASYFLQDVLISSDLFGSSPSAINESVSFNYARLMTTITLGGSTFQSCFDRRTNSPC